ncbi:MAG: HisA/HisF-related TIM barrel protein [Eggerthella lenta]
MTVPTTRCAGQLFEEQGATWLHGTSSGARSGTPENIAIVERIMRKTLLKVEVAAARSLDTIARLADAGVSRVVLGTSLVADPDFAEAAIAQYGKLLCAASTRGRRGGRGRVARGRRLAAEELRAMAASFQTSSHRYRATACRPASRPRRTCAWPRRSDIR